MYNQSQVLFILFLLKHLKGCLLSGKVISVVGYSPRTSLMLWIAICCGSIISPVTMIPL